MNTLNALICKLSTSWNTVRQRSERGSLRGSRALQFLYSLKKQLSWRLPSNVGFYLVRVTGNVRLHNSSVLSIPAPRYINIERVVFLTDRLDLLARSKHDRFGILLRYSSWHKRIRLIFDLQLVNLFSVSDRWWLNCYRSNLARRISRSLLYKFDLREIYTKESFIVNDYVAIGNLKSKCPCFFFFCRN